MTDDIALAVQGHRAARRLLDSAARRLLTMPPAAFVALVIVVTVVRAGLGFYGTWHTAQNAHALPHAYDYTSSGVTSGLLYRALHLNGLTWMALTAALVALAVLAPVVTTGRRSTHPAAWRLALLVMVAWQAVPATAQFLGDYQAVLLACVSVAMVARRWWAWSAMLALAALSGPETSALGFACLLIGTTAPALRPWRRKAVVGVILSLGWLAASSWWLAHDGVVSRWEYLVRDIVPTVSINAVQGLLGVYAWWGPWWVLVGLVTAATTGRHRWILLLATVLIPGLATTLTWDGTRVFVAVSAPIGLAMALAYTTGDFRTSRAGTPPEPKQSALAALVALWAVVLVLMPPLVSDLGVGFRAPWAAPAHQVVKRLGHEGGLIDTLLAR